MLAKNWQDLIKPSKLDIAASKSNPRQATIVAKLKERVADRDGAGLDAHAPSLPHDREVRARHRLRRQLLEPYPRSI